MSMTCWGDALDWIEFVNEESQRMNQVWQTDWAFDIGDRVYKQSGAAWSGKVVGFYSTTTTPRGYAVESENHRGSVQIYPEAALMAYMPKVARNG